MPPDVVARRFTPTASSGIPLAFVGLVSAAMVGAILLRTGGVFVYTLDDPYIHLALAEEIARGHYGVNPGAFAAPSSSVLWPLLLAPWARLPGASVVPLVLNLAAAFGTVVVYTRATNRTFQVDGPGSMWVVAAGMSVALVLTTNVVGLVFTGMEHSLQVFLAVAAVWGLWLEHDEGRLPRWLLPVLVLGPLVRYENLALTGPALVYLFVRGHRRSAVGAGVTVAAVLGAFSLFLVANGVGPLPSSVSAKSALDDGSGLQLVIGVVRKLWMVQGRLLALGGLALVATALSARRLRSERGLALLLAAAVGLHFVGGRFGWQSRYEVYVWAAALLALVLLYGNRWQPFVRREPVWKTAAIAAAAVGLVGAQFHKDTLLLPLAAQNIYEQQYQMHRLVTDYYPEPVAVNDLGLTTFRNDTFVLDLYGLGSDEALELRTTEPNLDWVSRLADRHGVELALVYDEWFPDFPNEWVPLGVLDRQGLRVSIGSNQVYLYARDRTAADRIEPALRRWAATLPAGTRFYPTNDE